jgi:S-adenosylmethionine hydrolase
MAMTASNPPASLITFLSDYGHNDEFVGVCHGVIARRAPNARVIDLTHAIPRHDVRAGALVLRAALAYVPAAIHLAVVDPGVGASGADARRAVAVRVVQEDRVLVGPDNGLLMLAAEELGGVVEALDIGQSPERLQPVSRTFHGRDIFAPVAAALAAGAELATLGQPLAADELKRLALPSARMIDGALAAHVLRCDHFGNMILDVSAELLEEAGVRPGEAVTVAHAGKTYRALYGATFADVAAGELVIYLDAERMIALALNQGSAAERLGAASGDQLIVQPQ